MNRAQVRVLGLQDGVGDEIDDRVDDDAIRWAFHRQLRQFREARKTATEPKCRSASIER